MQATKGFQAKTELYYNCVHGVDPSLPTAVAEIDLQHRMTPGYWRARQAERIALPVDRQQLRASRKAFGALPVIVLARGVSPYLHPGESPDETSKAVEEANLALLSEVAHPSTNAELRVVAGAGHVIQLGVSGSCGRCRVETAASRMPNQCPAGHRERTDPAVPT